MRNTNKKYTGVNLEHYNQVCDYCTTIVPHVYGYRAKKEESSFVCEECGFKFSIFPRWVKYGHSIIVDYIGWIKYGTSERRYLKWTRPPKVKKVYY